MSDDGDLTRADYYRLIRSQIEHEDELVNLRVVRQLLVQSFFFSAYATLLDAPQQAKEMVFERMQQLLTWLIPVAALLAGFSPLSASLRHFKRCGSSASNTRTMAEWIIAM
jgi:hypothetical protein